MKILDAVQECSGLRVLVSGPLCPDCGFFHGEGVHDKWLVPPHGLSVEEAERLIEEQKIRVQGRL